MYVQYTVPKPQTKTDIAIGVDMAIHKFDLAVAQARPELRRLETGGPDVFKPFLNREKYQESDDLGVTAIAMRAMGESELDVVKALLTSLTEEIKQSPYRPEDRGAIETLKSKDGDCTDYADLFVALCRAKGLPARTCEGYLTTSVPRDDTQKHDWVEVYLKDLGWVPFDPFHVDLNAAKVDALRPIYILLSNRRNDETLGNFHYWYLTSRTGKISGSDQYFIHWQREE
jgi:transglutaminase-like putative cysteine protease